MGDGLYTIKVERETRKSVPAAHLAPFYKLDEAVMYAPVLPSSHGGGGGGGGGNKPKPKPHLLPARVTSVDNSIWRGQTLP